MTEQKQPPIKLKLLTDSLNPENQRDSIEAIRKHLGAHDFYYMSFWGLRDLSQKINFEGKNATTIFFPGTKLFSKDQSTALENGQLLIKKIKKDLPTIKEIAKPLSDLNSLMQKYNYELQRVLYEENATYQKDYKYAFSVLKIISITLNRIKIDVLHNSKKTIFDIFRSLDE